MLQSRSHGLRDPFAAGLLRFFQQLFWYFDRNFPRRVHDPSLYHTRHQHQIWYFDSFLSAAVSLAIG